MAGVYTLPIYIVNMNHTMIKSGWMDQVIQRVENWDTPINTIITNVL